MKKSQRTVRFSVAEKEALKTFFDHLADEMSDSSCNDFVVRNTPSNYEMLESVIKHCHKKAERVSMLSDLEEQQESKMLNAFDTDVWDYLRWKLEKLIK